jgi:hypothetical protein
MIERRRTVRGSQPAGANATRSQTEEALDQSDLSQIKSLVLQGDEAIEF